MYKIIIFLTLLVIQNVNAEFVNLDTTMVSGHQAVDINFNDYSTQNFLSIGLEFKFVYPPGEENQTLAIGYYVSEVLQAVVNKDRPLQTTSLVFDISEIFLDASQIARVVYIPSTTLFTGLPPVQISSIQAFGELAPVPLPTTLVLYAVSVLMLFLRSAANKFRHNRSYAAGRALRARLC